ncbi:MAG: hypothetical protein ACYS8W_11115 [Planctomycetota bacterium]|jgi:hypothetical protein
MRFIIGGKLFVIMAAVACMAVSGCAGAPSGAEGGSAAAAVSPKQKLVTAIAEAENAIEAFGEVVAEFSSDVRDATGTPVTDAKKAELKKKADEAAVAGKAAGAKLKEAKAALEGAELSSAEARDYMVDIGRLESNLMQLQGRRARATAEIHGLGK